MACFVALYPNIVFIFGQVEPFYETEERFFLGHPIPSNCLDINSCQEHAFRPSKLTLYFLIGLDVAFLVDTMNCQLEFLKSLTRLHGVHYRTISSLSVDSLLLNSSDPESGKLLKIQMLSERFFNKLEPLLKG